MKKKLIFCICILLSMITCLSAVPISAYDYECPVEVTSASVLVVNMNTGTVVYAKNSDTAHFISYLSNLMTFIVAHNNITDFEKEITITDEVLAAIPNSDHSLDVFRGKTLTVTDLLYFVMMTNGNDACYVLADYVSSGNLEEFVSMMNKKARELGCTKTRFSSVAARNNTTQFSTCNDMYKIIRCALSIKDFDKYSSVAYYVPDGYDKDMYIVNTNSLVNSDSPYYFKHIINGKYGADSIAKGNCLAVSEYADVKYACVILGAQQLSEHNAFTETKQLLSWAYTQLADKRIVSKDTVIAVDEVQTPWGTEEVELTTGKDIEKTVPGNFEASKISFSYEAKNDIKLPVFKGQKMGVAQVVYDSQEFSQINLVAGDSIGTSLIEDVGDFLKTAFEQSVTPVNVPSEEPDASAQQVETSVETTSETNNAQVEQ